MAPHSNTISHAEAKAAAEDLSSVHMLKTFSTYWCTDLKNLCGVPIRNIIFRNKCLAGCLEAPTSARNDWNPWTTQSGGIPVAAFRQNWMQATQLGTRQQRVAGKNRRIWHSGNPRVSYKQGKEVPMSVSLRHCQQKDCRILSLWHPQWRGSHTSTRSVNG